MDIRHFFAIALAALLALSTGPGAARGQGQGFDTAQLPDLGNASNTVFSPREQERIGREVLREIRRSGALLEDPDVEEYVQGLGQHIAAHSDRPGGDFHFFIIRSRTINAFALPGGYIGINAGLILAADTEAELAGVVAHEIAHVTQHHIARQIESQQGSGLATLGALLGAILVAANTGESDVALAGVLTTQALQLQRQINYTRAHEYEADRIGIKMLMEAGYDPEGMATFFEKLQQRTRFSAGAAVPEYMRTHPLTRSRITEARNRARDAGDVRRTSSRRFYLVREHINARLAAAGDGEIINLTPSRSPVELGFATDLQRYREAVTLQYRGQHASAARLFNQLRNANPDVISYHLGYAESLMSLGRQEEALAVYENGQRLFPRNETLMESHARSLLDAGRADDALLLVEELVRLPGARARHHHLLARAASEAGFKAESHYHMAGYYQQQGDIYNAITQIRLALAHPMAESARKERYNDRLQGLVSEWERLPSEVQRAQQGRDRQQ